MPVYEYECTKGHQFEVEQRISDKPLARCKVCRAKARRLISRTSFVLKGGGWYSDGYGASKKNGGDAGGGSKSETRSEAKSDAKPESKPESKPAGKSSDKGSSGTSGSSAKSASNAD
jgi:putative FmdB family regulatory protein